MNKVVVFGSTGMTGKCAVEAAVNKGLNVRAFVRDPSKLPDHLRNSVEVVMGDVLNYNDVLKAVRDVTGVVVVLGTNNDLKPTTVLSEGAKNIVRAMQESNVEIISACFSVFLMYEQEKIPAMFHDLNEDHKREYEVIRQSGLKYIAVMPPHIADTEDKPGSEYQITHDSPAPSRVVTKHELGRFLVDSLTQPEHYGKACGICTKN